MFIIRVSRKINRSINQIKSKFRSFLFFGKINKVAFGVGVKITGTVEFGNNISISDYSELRGNMIKIADNVVIHENVFLRGDPYIEIGTNTTLNRNTCILDSVRIGNNCAIAPNVVIVGSNHNFKSRNILIKSQGMNSQGIVIEDDVWIAANVTILDGVTIAKGTVVAAGAVVSKSTQPYSIVGGVPAKIIGSRDV